MARTISVVARIPRNPTAEERLKAPASWPVRLAFASEEDAETHRRWWRPRIQGFVTFASIVQIPPSMRAAYDALKALLRAEIGDHQ